MVGDVWFGIFGWGSLFGDLWFGIFGLRSLVWALSLGNFHLGVFGWDVSFGVFCLGADKVEKLPFTADCIKVSYMRSSYLSLWAIQKPSNNFLHGVGSTAL